MSESWWDSAIAQCLSPRLEQPYSVHLTSGFLFRNATSGILIECDLHIWKQHFCCCLLGLHEEGIYIMFLCICTSWGSHSGNALPSGWSRSGIHTFSSISCIIAHLGTIELVHLFVHTYGTWNRGKGRLAFSLKDTAPKLLFLENFYSHSITEETANVVVLWF